MSNNALLLAAAAGLIFWISEWVLGRLQRRDARVAREKHDAQFDLFQKKLANLAGIVGVNGLRVDLLAEDSGREFYMTDPVPEKVERTPGAAFQTGNPKEEIETVNYVKRIVWGILLSLATLWVIGIHIAWPANAADQNTTLLVALQASIANLNGKVAGLDAKVTTMSDQQRSEQLSVRRRLNDVEQKALDLANGMADLDAARQNQTVVSLAARISSVETKLDDAKKEREAKDKLDKDNHDALMAWLRPGVGSIFATLLSVLAAIYVAHRKDLREQKSKQRSAVATAAQDDRSAAATAVQDERLDAIERDHTES